MPNGTLRTPGDEKVLSDLELLKRCNYLLTQSESDWSGCHKELASQLFEKFPSLQTA